MPFCGKCNEHYFEKGLLGGDVTHRCPPMWNAFVVQEPEDLDEEDTPIKVRGRQDYEVAEKAMDEAYHNWAWEGWSPDTDYHIYIRPVIGGKRQHFRVSGESVIRWSAREIKRE